MPGAKSGRVHILHQLAVPGGVAAEDAGNHFLLRLTRRSQRCRSGSEISRAGFYQRQGARGRRGSVEGGWLLNGLIFSKYGDEIWGQTGSFLVFLFVRIKNYRKRSVCPQVSQVSRASPQTQESAKSAKFATSTLHGDRSRNDDLLFRRSQDCGRFRYKSPRSTTMSKLDHYRPNCVFHAR